MCMAKFEDAFLGLAESRFFLVLAPFKKSEDKKGVALNYSCNM